jgi:hypothetical protein
VNFVCTIYSTTVVSSVLEAVTGLTVVVDKELVSINISVIGGVVNKGFVGGKSSVL